VARTIRWEADAAWYADWIARRREALTARSVPRGPLVSIVMPCHDTPADYLAGTLSSITAQTYPNWELCLADDGSSSTATLEVLSRYSRGDPRIHVTHLPANRGIAAASNAALALARGALVVPMDHDDLLPEYALATLVEAVTNSPEAKLAYSDSDRIDSVGEPSRPFFKPAWNYDLFLAQNYLNHLTAIDAGLLRSVGGWREGYEGSQDYDLYLRLVEVLERPQILHIPEVLYHWREHQGSFSQSRLAGAVRAARRAIADHLQRTGRTGTVSAPPGALIYNHIRRALPDRRARLTLILLGSPSPAMAGLIRDGCDGNVRLDIEVRTLDAGPDLVGRIDAELADASGTELVMLLNGATRELPGAALEELAARSLCGDAGCVGPKCIDAWRCAGVGARAVRKTPVTPARTVQPTLAVPRRRPAAATSITCCCIRRPIACLPTP
jgi:GT2 family glycosyltransferase